MKKGIIIILALIGLCILAFCAYLIADNIRLKNAYRNYPVAYTELIEQYAREYELDPYLVTAIMRCESSNNPKALSEAGAMGLMQVMPGTGTWVAHKLGMDDEYVESMLYDPETSIRFGCWYLWFLHERFDGNQREVIAAYNAGHGSVEKWLSDPQYTEGGELLSIPFPETARYYDKVTTAYDNYRVLYPELYQN